ncbi:MAG: hydroxymethylbilane synthase [Aureispira sp.]|nr:hydroxymethylbilane synthase [Aureispira sp.]
MTKLIIGTRGSKLALWQAHYTLDKLTEAGVEAELKIIKTKGDKIQHLSFDKIEGKGFFTKEIEDALLQGEIDMAVHSMKDMPTAQPEGLALAAVSYRENPADWLFVRKDVANPKSGLKLQENAIVGTSSARRKAQLLAIQPDIQIKDIRGNVPTRLQKLREGQFDAIMLAAAGVSRLELDVSDFEVVKFEPKHFVPAPAQGVLAFQIREEDKLLRKTLQILHSSDVVKCTNVERTVLKMMDGGCQMPLGVYCERDHMGYYHAWGAKAENWDAPVRRSHVSSSTYVGLAEKVYDQLMNEA